MKTYKSFFGLLLTVGLASQSLTGQTTHIVTSTENDGQGSLRQAIENADTGDNILIDETVMLITLESRLDISKSITIDGNNTTISTPDPGVSPFRLMNIGTNSSSNVCSVSLYNMTLRGGRVAANEHSTVADNSGGTVLVRGYGSLYMKNVSVSQGIGNYSGAIHSESAKTGLLVFESCTFSNNEGTTGNAGAIYFKGDGTLKNCIFENNKIEQNGSAIATNAPNLQIENCIFKNNISRATGTYGGAIFNTSGGNAFIKNSTFEVNDSEKGAGAFGCSGTATATIFTNCTFYGNTGVTTGGFYVYQGTANFINCTFSGNTGSGSYGGAGFVRNDASAKGSFVNTIAVYNYKNAALSDISSGTSAVLSGDHNLMGVVSAALTSTFTNHLAFSDGETLFSDYTTLNAKKVPVLSDNGGFTPTIAILQGGKAHRAGTTSFGSFSVPLQDQRGIIRSSTAPSIGSFDVVCPTPLQLDVRLSGNDILLTWESSSSSFVVECKPLSDNWENAVSVPTGDFHYLLSGIPEGVEYTWRVKTICSAGFESDWVKGGQFTNEGKVEDFGLSADYTHIIGYGQSLSLGSKDDLLVSPSGSSYSQLLMFDVGPRTYNVTNDNQISSFVSLKEAKNSSYAETPMTGLGEMLLQTIEKENGALNSDQKIVQGLPGKGGTSVAGLSKDGSSPERYAAMMYCVKAGNRLATQADKTFNVPVFTWTQGEQDVYEFTTPMNYKNRVIRLQQDLNADVKAVTGQSNDVKCVMFQTASYNRYNLLRTTANRQKYPDIAVAQYELCRDSNNFILAMPAYILDYVTSDNVHLTAESSRLLGAYYGYVIKKLLVDKEDWKPLYPLSHTVLGNEIVIKFYVPVKPLTIDTDWVKEIDNFGFNLYRNNNELKINSVAIISEDELKITCEQNVLPGDKLTYGINGTVTGRYRGSRGNVRDNQGDTITYDINCTTYHLHNWLPIYEVILNQ